MRNNWIIKIQDSGFKTSKDVYIFLPLPNGKIETFDGKVQDYGVTIPPSLELEDEQLQLFADALDKSGYKPQKGFLEGKLEATSKHLEDMRSLVFIKTPLPK